MAPLPLVGTDVMILAAGMGMRMRPLTTEQPKPLLPVQGRPLLAWNVAVLARMGARRIVINAHHCVDLLDAFVRDGLETHLEELGVAHRPEIRVVKELILLGTAGGLANASPLLRSDPVLTWNVDLLFQPKIEDLFATHAAEDDTLATLVLTRSPLHAKIRLENGRIESVAADAAPSDSSLWGYTGIALYSQDALCRLPSEFAELPGFLREWAREGRLRGCPSDAEFLEIGTLDSYLRVHRRLAVNPELLPGIPGSEIEPLSDFGFVSTRASVHSQATVSESLILPGARLQANARVERSIIGARADVDEAVFGQVRAYDSVVRFPFLDRVTEEAAAAFLERHSHIWSKDSRRSWRTLSPIHGGGSTRRIIRVTAGAHSHVLIIPGGESEAASVGVRTDASEASAPGGIGSEASEASASGSDETTPTATEATEPNAEAPEGASSAPEPAHSDEDESAPRESQPSEKEKDATPVIYPVRQGPGVPTEAQSFVYAASVLDRRGVRVPSIRVHEEDSGIFLVEDLGSQTLEDVVRKERVSSRDAVDAYHRVQAAEEMRSGGEDEGSGDSAQSNATSTAKNRSHELYREAVDFLVRLQRPTEPFDPEQTFAPALDAAFLLEFEAGYFQHRFVETLAGFGPPSSELQNEYGKLTATATSLEPVLVHRDYQSRNLMVTPRGLVVIDFQGCRLGPPFYDLASLLHDPYVALDESLKMHLFETFCERTEIRPDDEIWAAVSICRLLQALGAFAYLGHELDRPGFLDHAHVALAVARDLAKPEYPHLSRLLDELMETEQPWASPLA